MLEKACFEEIQQSWGLFTPFSRGALQKNKRGAGPA
jgi:hypothetical protein